MWERAGASTCCFAGSAHRSSVGCGTPMACTQACKQPQWPAACTCDAAAFRRGPLSRELHAHTVMMTAGRQRPMRLTSNWPEARSANGPATHAVVRTSGSCTGFCTPAAACTAALDRWRACTTTATPSQRMCARSALAMSDPRLSWLCSLLANSLVRRASLLSPSTTPLTGR